MSLNTSEKKISISGRAVSRRQFLQVSAAGAAAMLAGCATNPVTGKKQLMFVSEDAEIKTDLQYSPHQVSSDYGALQDEALNRYIAEVGDKLASVSHRPNMPYSFRGVNAVYVNAYAFPGGSIAITRGMLLAMNSEAELAAVMGHEIGHVCSRHTAQSMTQGYMCQGGLILTGLIVNTATNGKYKDWVDMGSGLGSIGAGALLARYSRAHEREADGLSLKYMTAGGYNPQGAVDLMDLLRKLSKSNPNVIEMLFATHPMSEERYQTMLQESRSTYAQHSALPLHREIYLDRTASLRAMKGAIEKMQKGEEALADKKLNDADTFLTSALKLAPDDYAGLLLMARLRLAQKKWAEAERLAGDARAVYPREPQSYYLSGMAKVKAKRFDPAYKDFGDYERMLPGNPNTIFYLGYCEEGLGRREAAANHYKTYVENSNETEEHKYAYQRLLEWGYIQPPAAQGQKSS